MPVVRLKNINKVRSRGRLYYYHRKTGVRLPDDPASAEFHSAWKIEEQKAAGLNTEPQAGTLGGLMKAYRSSPEFARLADRTKRDYNGVMDWLAVSFQEVVHPAPTEDAEVAEALATRRGTRWTSTTMPA